MKVYEKKSFPRTTRDFKSMMEAGKLSFDNAVQRSFVWKNTAKDNRMSMLIDSMIRGLPIPPMYCNCLFTDPNHKVYDFIDGKQRITTVNMFVNDEFKLIGLPTFDLEDGSEIDLNGLKYSELPEEFRDNIRIHNFVIYYYENMSQDDAEEMFRRLNNGKSLTAIELTRATSKSKKQIKKLSSHELFHAALSEKSLAAYANEDIVIKTWIVLYSDSKSLETKNVRPIMRAASITAEQAAEIEVCFNVVLNEYKYLKESDEKYYKSVIRKLLTKTHLISLMPVFREAAAHDISDEELKDWLISFYETDKKDCSINEQYNVNSTKGSASENAVLVRLKILKESFDKFTNQKK